MPPRNSNHGECMFLMLQLSACAPMLIKGLSVFLGTLLKFYIMISHPRYVYFMCLCNLAKKTPLNYTKVDYGDLIVCTCVFVHARRGISQAIRTSWATLTQA